MSVRAVRAREHWEAVYGSKDPSEVSWYRPHLEHSLRFIEEAGLDRDAAIIDIGGGASTLVDDLVARGYRNVSVLDVSPKALQSAQALYAEFGGGFEKVGRLTEIHSTPWGAEQQFVYCYCRLLGS